ncbi:MAG: VWA domain-containing protein [Ruegeria sp.]
MRRKYFCSFALTTAILAASESAADENVMVVFDGSNSMWGQIDGTAKVEIARGVMENLLGDWAETRNVGLMAYGHRRRGDCGDIELLVPPGQRSRQAILDQINGITPTGKTPLTDAVEAAAEALSYVDQPATVVLISDGLESCERDPCALAQALEKGGVGFTAHVVGFGLGADEDASSLACIAENTGGEYITASSAEELGAAFSTVASAVAQPEPEEPPQPIPQQVTVEGPDTAVGGSNIQVTWTPTIAEADYINVVPVGTDPGTFGTYVRIGDATEIKIPVPGGEGLYEIQYLHNQSKEVLGLDNLEVTKPMVELTTEDTAATGAKFALSWTPTINQRDYVAIVPAGSDPGTFGNYQTVGNKNEAMLVAPADPGLYEVRYILNVDKRTVASRQIEIGAATVVLQVPQTASTGAAFDVGWSAAVSEQDYINIVPVGTDEGKFGNYITVRDKTQGTLKAPAQPGMYEVRYVLREGNRTLAADTIEVTAPTVTVSGPDQVITGAKFDVSWTGGVHVQDYVAIVPAGSEEGVYGNYAVVRDGSSTTLVAPADPGLYELRYILREGAKTLASAPIEVTTPEVTMTAPDKVLAGSKFEVSWTGAVSAQDYVNIVPVGADEGTFGNYVTVRNVGQADIQAPSQPGLYEIRYVLREGSRTIASNVVEVVEPEVTIRAPLEVRAGDKLRVSWTGTVSTSDYINLVPMGTKDGEFGSYIQVRNNSEVDLNAPAETGLYELRYQLREGNRVMARQPVEVLGADAALDTGATLDAPDTAAPGTRISVGWNTDSDGADQRITLARGEQAIFTWIAAEKIESDAPVELTLPDEPGVYEIRLLDLTNQKVLSRKVIKVE